MSVVKSGVAPSGGVGAPQAASCLRVDPHKLNLVCEDVETRRMLLEQTNAVLDGDWDKTEITFDQLDLFAACQQRFVDRLPWEETEFYRRVIRDIANGVSKWGCSSEDAFRARLENEIDVLFETIRDHGYATQDELGNEPLRDEVCVAVSREGQFVFVDGKHRLSIARILGLPTIPVRVVARHKHWMEFRQELAEFAAGQLRGHIYQAIDHPDLSDFPAHKDHGRRELIRVALSDYDRAGKRSLDIGAQWGYMTQQMEAFGFQSVGVEASGTNVRFARRIKTAVEGQYEIWHGKIFEYPESAAADVIVALNIFHHLIKTHPLHAGLEAFLQKLQADVLIFEPHLPKHAWRQMEGAYRNYEPDQFVDFVSRHTGMQSIELIGTASDGRPLYKLARI